MDDRKWQIIQEMSLMDDVLMTAAFNDDLPSAEVLLYRYYSLIGTY